MPGEDAFSNWARDNVEPNKPNPSGPAAPKIATVPASGGEDARPLHPAPTPPPQPAASPEALGAVMTKEEAARKWSQENNFCIIPWAVIDELVDIYRKHGSQNLVFDVVNLTYSLADKPKARKNAKRKSRTGRS